MRTTVKDTLSGGRLLVLVVSLAALELAEDGAAVDLEQLRDPTDGAVHLDGPAQEIPLHVGDDLAGAGPA